jgi:hypothetical protein
MRSRQSEVLMHFHSIRCQEPVPHARSMRSVKRPKRTYAGRITTLLFIGSLTICVACSNQLDREKAAKKIDDDPRFATVTIIPLVNEGRSREGFDAGILEGLWVPNPNGGRTLTDKGKQFFADERATLVKPATRQVVNITGITDVPGAQNVKEVDFEWRFSDLPDVVERYTGEGHGSHTGKATFQLFDDGWRMQEVQAQEAARVPFQWTPALLKQLETERTARRPTKTLAKFRLGQGGFAAGSGTVIFIELTDTNIKLRDLSLRDGFDQWLRDGTGPVGIYAVNSDVNLAPIDLADVVRCRIEPSSLTGSYFAVYIETTKGTTSIYHNSAEASAATVKSVCDQIMSAAQAWRAKWRR